MTYYISVICAIIAGVTVLYALMKARAEDMNTKKDEGHDKPGIAGIGCMQGKKRYDILTAVGFGILILLRICRMGDIPAGVNQDEAMAAVDALALANYGTDRFGMSFPVHLTAWGFAQMSALNSYLLIPFVKIWGLVSWAIRLPALIISILGAAAVWGIAKRSFDKNTALILLFLTAINPWHLMQSRWEIDCNLFPHLFVIGLYFLLRTKENIKYLYLSMVFFALCMYAYGVSFYMVPFFLILMCIRMRAGKEVTKMQALLAAGIYFLIAWPICLTMLINFAGWDTIRVGKMTIPCFADSMRARDILFFTENPWEQLGSNFRSLLNISVLQSGDSPWNAIDGFGAVYWCSILFVPVGVLALLQKRKSTEEKEKKICCEAVLIYFAVSVLQGLIISNVNTNRINIIFYAQLILIAVGIKYVIHRCRKALLVLMAVYGCMAALFAGTYFGSYNQIIHDSFFVDLVAAIDRAEEFDSSRYYIAMAYEYNEAANCAEILTMYTQQLDAHYFQGEDTEKISYDPDSPLTQKGIPYAERYRYYLPGEDETGALTDVVYVLRAEHRERFPEEDFVIEDFGSYILVYPVK